MNSCFGEVSERLKVQTWKVCVGAISPRVRIPPSPFLFYLVLQIFRMSFMYLNVQFAITRHLV